HRVVIHLHGQLIELSLRRRRCWAAIGVPLRLSLPPLRRSRRSQPLSRFEQDGGCRFPCLHIEEFRHAAALQPRNWGMCGLLEGAFGFAARRSSGLTITPTSTRRCGPARAVPVFEYEVFELPATMWAGPHQLLLSLDDRAALIQVGITCRTDARV